MWPYAIAALVLLAAGGLLAGYALGPHGTRQAGATTSLTASPTGLPRPSATFNQHATCVLVLPVLRDATDQVMELVDHPDGSTVDRAKVTKVIKDLETTLLVAPDSMHADIGVQLDFMRQFQRLVEGSGGGSIDQHPFAQSGIRLGQICSLYAS